MHLTDARIAFLGTPAFAVPSLEALVRASARIVGVVTQPDKPAGRGRQLRESTVAQRARELRLTVSKLEGLKKEEHRAFLRDLRPDLLVVVAYGKLLPQEVLDLPRFGAVGVHASLLPKYRGPAPIPAAILAGDPETGVTIMKLDEGMDTGPILAQERIPIAPDDTTTTLSVRLSAVGARLLVPTLERYLAGELSPVPQGDAQATRCPMLKKEDGRIDWGKPASSLARLVRAYDPWPRAFTMWGDRRLIIRKATPGGLDTRESLEQRLGSVIRTLTGIAVVTGDGALLLLEVQLAGREPSDLATLARGYPHFIGSTLR